MSHFKELHTCSIMKEEKWIEYTPIWKWYGNGVTWLSSTGKQTDGWSVKRIVLKQTNAILQWGTLSLGSKNTNCLSILSQLSYDTAVYPVSGSLHDCNSVRKSVFDSCVEWIWTVPGMSAIRMEPYQLLEVCLEWSTQTWCELESSATPTTVTTTSSSFCVFFWIRYEWVGRDTWTYSRSFVIDYDTQGQLSWLHCEGIDTVAEILCCFVSISIS